MSLVRAWRERAGILSTLDHPLAIEQRDGIAAQRVSELFTQMVHES